jgi:L-lactate dehydrogenase
LEEQIAESAINASVLGEHGDSQFVSTYSKLSPTNSLIVQPIAWSSATIGGSPLQSILPLDPDRRDEIATATRRKAYEIIKVKGATAYGIAAVVSSICESILFDQRHIRPLSHWQDNLGCCLSMPAVIGRRGILSTIAMPLDDKEEDLLNISAAKMREIVQALNIRSRLSCDAPN